MSESAIASASALGSLSGAGLLGLMVLALAGVVICLLYTSDAADE